MTNNAVVDIEERVNRLLQDSLDELYLLRRDEVENLGTARERSLALTQELRDLAARIDNAVRDYDHLREALLESAKLGRAAEEKALYEQASTAMAGLSVLEERHRLLSTQKLDLMNEERRLERSVARSDNMGNRLRMVLNLMTTPEDLLADGAAAHSAETLSAALQVVEREAAAFTRELHDGPTQTFSAVGLTLEMARAFLEKNDIGHALAEIDVALGQIRDGLNELRALLFSLSPTGIQEGFDAPLRRLTSQLSQMRGCRMSYVLNGSFGDIPVNTKIGAFKTLHQAVLNAVFHGATEVKVSIRYARKILEVRVADNGEGFDVEREKEAVKERASYGLRNMEERVKMMGGKIVISSVLKKGSSVSFSVPVRHEPPDENRQDGQSEAEDSAASKEAKLALAPRERV
jgi:two-component system sensor histidine kinase DegS